MHYMPLFLFLNLIFAFQVYGAVCTNQTYASVSFTEIKSEFSPYERIFVQIDCSTLKRGDHSLVINWVHEKSGIVRSDRHDFEVKQEGAGHTAYFWFKLTRRGPIKSALTNQDFYQGHMGDWVAEAALNDRVVASQSFVIRAP